MNKIITHITQILSLNNALKQCLNFIMMYEEVFKFFKFEALKNERFFTTN